MPETIKLGDFVAVRPANNGFGYNREGEVKEIAGVIPNRRFKVVYANKESETVSSNRIVEVTINQGESNMGFEVTYTENIGIRPEVVTNHPEVTFELGELTENLVYVNTLSSIYLSLIFDALKEQEQDDDDNAWHILNTSVIKMVAD